MITWWEAENPPDWEGMKHKVKYLAYGHETCPDTGRPHLQMFAYAKTPMRYTQWERLLKPQRGQGKWWRWAKMRGDFEENEEYCAKQSELVEFGIRPKQGQRSDIEAMKEKLRDAGQKPL